MYVHGNEQPVKLLGDSGDVVTLNGLLWACYGFFGGLAQVTSVSFIFSVI